MEFVSFDKRTYNDFERQIPEKSKLVFDLIRRFCMSLDEKVVEDIRMHRIVFGKSMTFRWFVDIEPKNDCVVVKIQKNRKQAPSTYEVKTEQDLIEIKNIIKEAFEEIH